MRNNNDYSDLPPISTSSGEHYTILEALAPSPSHYRDNLYDDDTHHYEDENHLQQDSRYIPQVQDISNARYVEYIDAQEDIKYDDISNHTDIKYNHIIEHSDLRYSLDPGHIKFNSIPEDIKYNDISDQSDISGHDRLDQSSQYIDHDYKSRVESIGGSRTQSESLHEGQDCQGFGDVCYEMSAPPSETHEGETFTVSYNVYNTNINGGPAKPSDILRQAFADLDM